MALIDDITILITAGNGGDGGRSFHTNYGSVKSHSDGGNGGRGGNIYFEGTANLNDLSEFRFKKKIKAPDGEKGMNKNLDGRGGEDITVLVPLGTTLIDTSNARRVEIMEENLPVLMARGGQGQAGNHDRHVTITKYYEPRQSTQPGQEKELHLILNMIADIGLIGLPNAGKSSLLKALTAADPKIGNYPFTTLEPNLGVIPSDKPHQTVLADIPGLVEGASEGKGLGIRFLKHIQKTKVLLHCIDATQNDVLKTYETVRGEFEAYDESLLAKKEIILLTKTDLATDEQIEEAKKALKKTKRTIIEVSIYQPEGLTALKDKIEKLI